MSSSSLGEEAVKQRTSQIMSQAGKSHDKMKEEELKESLRQQWPWLRKACYGLVGNHWFEVVCGAIILFNMIVVVFETDATVDDGEPEAWIGALTNCLLGIYTTELMMKLYVFRLAFFHEMWNNLDFFIIGIDLVFLFISLVVDQMPSISILRVFRLVRLARAFKAAKSFHELNCLLRACGCALKAIFWGMVMLTLTLTVWGILAVQLIHPINKDIARNKPWLYAGCDRCPRAFSTVFDSIVTFFKQLVAGDSWGTLCEPIIEEQNWTFFFFILVLVTVSLTMLNCILAVVVEAGAAAAAADEHDKAIQREKMVMQAEGKLVHLCRGLDADDSGSLNIDEFLKGYRCNASFRECLEVMHVTESDMFMIFNICDEDDSGDVDYMEFVDQLRRIKHSGQEMLLHYVTDIRHMVNTIEKQMVKAKLVTTNSPGGAASEGNKEDEQQVQVSAQNAEEASAVRFAEPEDDAEDDTVQMGASPSAKRKGTCFASKDELVLQSVSIQPEPEDNSKATLPNRPARGQISVLKRKGTCFVRKSELAANEEIASETASSGGAADPPDSMQMKVDQLEQRSVAAREAIRNAENFKPDSKDLGFHMHRMKIEMEHIYRINADLVAIMSDVSLQSKVQTGLLNKLISSGTGSTYLPKIADLPGLSQPSSERQPNGADTADFAHFVAAHFEKSADTL